jgi:imidazole glycerol-phosphate synthase subunit HisH
MGVKSTIIIIDYKMGNILSIVNKIHRVGYNAIVTNEFNLIKTADKLILPGVGHFQKAVENLKRLQLSDVLNEAVLIKKIPILGICLGMQLMARHSEEGDVDGLDWVDADVVRFRVSDQLRYKVPHIGWNNAIIEKDSPLYKDVPKEAMYYFVHSYHIKCNNKEDILTTTEYDYSFTSSIQKNNIFGTQFHPEKSHDAGELLLRNFVEM